MTLPEPAWYAPQMITEDAYSAEQMRHAQQEAALTFTAAQAQNLLDMFGGDEGLITVCLLPADGDNPGGLYGYMTEYPEDGSVFLGPANEDAEPTQPQSPAPTPAQDERQAFEAWCKQGPANLERLRSGPYISSTVSFAWGAWQAARAAPPQIADAQPVARVIVENDDGEAMERCGYFSEWLCKLPTGEHLLYLAQPPASQDDNARDAARWKEIFRRFSEAKSSACDRVLEALRLPNDKEIDEAIDSAISASTAKEQT
jgi:hypothetical protein